MSENTNSVTDNESPKVELNPNPNPNPNQNQKRGSDSEDKPDGIVVKKAKTEVFFEIQADAAEDKGSRHTMEDAWVVLLDAAAYSPGKLRSFMFS
jgi:integrin-linked kinase-associated serine/threonine phosphatase 2C